MRSQSFLLIILTLISVASARAQARLDVVNWNYSNAPVFLYEPDTLPLSFYIKNSGADSVQGTIEIQHSLNGVLQLVPLHISTATSVIIPGDSLLFDIDYIPEPSKLKPGENIIVIWPKAVEAEIGEAAMLKVDFTPLTAARSVLPEDIRIWIDQEKRLLLWQNAYVEQVRIFDLSGRLLYHELVQGNQLPLQYLNSGFYFIELKMKNSQSVQLKVMF